MLPSAFRPPRSPPPSTPRGGTVYTYEFAWPTPVRRLGACHALELGFVFDTLSQSSAVAGETAPQQLADEMHRAWVAFARKSDPGWTAWTPERPAVMSLALESEVVNGPRADELALWPAG